MDSENPIHVQDKIKVFGGLQLAVSHPSAACRCDMRFSIYLPPARKGMKLPVLYWLSGLTCTDENFLVKAGAQRYAAAHGVAIVCPDTSPRGEGVPDAPDNAWDLGSGAGFYVNATQAPWSTHYHMYDYVVSELPALVEQHFPVEPGLRAISGHSMGGHGAITIALKNPGRYRSVSAFAPICAPSRCPWGEKAFGAYLGEDRERWLDHDACALIAQARERLPLLVDQGDADAFLREQLMPERLEAACREADYPLTLRMQPGYDHSYYFIATFVGDHIEHHARALQAAS